MPGFNPHALNAQIKKPDIIVYINLEHSYLVLLPQKGLHKR